MQSHARPGVVVVAATPSHSFRSQLVSITPAPKVIRGNFVSTVGLRQGYCQYVQDWRDTHFYYPRYAYVPGPRIHYSPWYYYSNLPAYVTYEVIIVHENYEPPVVESTWVDYPETTRRPVDNLKRDLIDAFLDFKPEFISDHVQAGKEIAILMDGEYQYSLKAEDFQQMATDLIKGTNTTDYRVDKVRQSGRNINIRTTHEFTDASGQAQSVRHEYVFQQDLNGGYWLREFHTEH